jgi:hypothetical protein
MSDQYFQNYDEGQRVSSPTDGTLLTPGAMPPAPRKASVRVFSSSKEQITDDFRVRIRVPGNYITRSTAGNSGRDELANGIIFPYTPTIIYENKADYNVLNVTHNNYSQYFYNNSSVSAITITGKLTVQSDKDAWVYLSIKHLLSALTKMPFADDPGAGAPPPICRLDAYGEYMLKNVPVVISSYKIELPQEVDYYSVGNNIISTSASNPAAETDSAELQEVETSSKVYKSQNLVPVLSNITVTCTPIYSRKEMLEFSLEKFLKEYENNTKYL